MPTADNTNDPSKPDFLRADVVAAAPDLALIRSLLAGPRAMWDESTTYIRKWTDEDRKVYDIRRLCEPCTDLFGRTLSASVGKLFAKPPTIDFGAQEALFAAHWDNIDAAGAKGDIAIKEFAADAIADGYALILVDHVPAPVGETVTSANEVRLGLRPTWAFYDRAAVYSWRTETRGHAEIVAQLVLAESAEETLGAFGTTAVTLYRELFLSEGVAAWRLWRAPLTDDAPFTILGTGVFRNRRGETRDTLPIAVGYAGRRRAPFVADPPLRGVAYANLAHWRLATELTFGRQVSAIEQPVVKGALMNADGSTGGKLKLGWMTGQQVEAAGDFFWRGPSGVGLDQLAKGKVEKEQEIAAMGLSFISRDTRAAETAEAKRLDAAAEDSTLATAGQGLEDAVNLAWELHAWYEGVEKADAPSVSVNTDFDAVGLSAQDVTAIAGLVREGLHPRHAVRVLVQGGALQAADEAAEEEIWMEWAAGQDAAATMREMDAQGPRLLPDAA